MSINYTADQLQRKFQNSPGSSAFARLAEVMRGDGRIDEAIGVCQEGLRLHPQQLSGYLVLGKCLMDANRMEEAREKFEAVLRLDSRCLSAMHYLATIMTKLQWGEAAHGYYRSILEVEPWDREVQALVDSSQSVSDYAPPSSAESPADFAPAGRIDAGSGSSDDSAFGAGTVSAPAESDTFEKPPGFKEDVLEFNLNDVGDFLPTQGAAGDAEDVSLEDALSVSQSESPAPRAFPSARVDREAEPQPKDILKDVPAEANGATALESAPISGQDVEDRLDSLFGSDEDVPAAKSGFAPAPVPAAAAPAFKSAPPVLGPDIGDATTIQTEAFTATQDLALPPDQERVSGEDIEKRLDDLFSLGEDGESPQAKSARSSQAIEAAPATNATNEFSATQEPKATNAFEASASDGAVIEGGPGTAESEIQDLLFAPEPEAKKTTSPDDVITGQDVVDKLDTFFGTDAPRAEWTPQLPGVEDSGTSETETDDLLKDESALGLGEKPALPPDSGIKPWDDDMEASQPPSGEIMSTESMLPPGWLADAGTSPQVTGSDIEAQLDKLFNLEDDTPKWTAESPAESAPAATAAAAEAKASPSEQFPAPAEQIPPHIDQMPGEDPDRTMVMPAVKAPSPEPESIAPVEGNTDDTGSAHDTGTLDATRRPNDTGSLKESVTDWLARQAEPSENPASGNRNADLSAGDTLVLPNEDVEDLQDFPTIEMPVQGDLDGPVEETDVFGSLSTGEMERLADTQSIEMVDGADVADRLDELFAEEGMAGNAASFKPQAAAQSQDPGEMSLFIQEDGTSDDAPTSEAANAAMVSGEDVSSRLSEMFGDGSGALQPMEDFKPEHGLPEPLDLQSFPEATPSAPMESFSSFDTPSQTETAPTQPSGSSSSQLPPASAVPNVSALPMQDEEGYPDEEETPAQTAAAANVATVTLAEIYFQQGLREQALQIYRQLLEREPGNDSVRKRIQEIEASKPEGDKGTGSDPRRPRPGLKVPKRKK